MIILDFLKELLGLEMYNIVAQIFGILGLCVLLLAFMQKDDIRTKILMTFALSFWFIHYSLLGLVGAMCANAIGLLRMYFSLKHPGNKAAVLFTFCLTLGVGVVMYDGLVSILPIIASLVGIVSFQLLRGIPMRIGLIIVSLLWLFYTIINGSIPGMVNEILSQIVLITTIIKIYFDDHKKLSMKETFVQKVKYMMNSKKARKRVDFGRFTIFRDKKRYLEDNNIVYEKD